MCISSSSLPPFLFLFLQELRSSINSQRLKSYAFLYSSYVRGTKEVHDIVVEIMEMMEMLKRDGIGVGSPRLRMRLCHEILAAHLNFDFRRHFYRGWFEVSSNLLCYPLRSYHRNSLHLPEVAPFPQLLGSNDDLQSGVVFLGSPHGFLGTRWMLLGILKSLPGAK